MSRNAQAGEQVSLAPPKPAAPPAPPPKPTPTPAPAPAPTPPPRPAAVVAPPAYVPPPRPAPPSGPRTGPSPWSGICGGYTTDPSFLRLNLPTKYRATEALSIQIMNKTMDRIVFKVECSQPKKFVIQPVYGFVDPMMKSQPIELQPKQIPKDGLKSWEERVMSNIGMAAVDDTDAEGLWKANPKPTAVIETEICIPKE